MEWINANSAYWEEQANHGADQLIQIKRKGNHNNIDKDNYHLPIKFTK